MGSEADSPAWFQGISGWPSLLSQACPVFAGEKRQSFFFPKVYYMIYI
jgi:hypothetical protein